jgi:hypothetical protein
VTCVERERVSDISCGFWRHPSNLVLDDYVWMGKDGSLTLFRNYHNPPFWGQGGIIYVPGDLMIGHTRKDVFLADRESPPWIKSRHGNYC